MNINELYHRLRKSIHLADILDACAITPEIAATLSQEQWRLFAKLAGVPPPSGPETVQEVVTLLNNRVAARERIAVCQ